MGILCIPIIIEIRAVFVGHYFLAQYFKMLICIVLVILGNLKGTRDGELIGLERNTSYDIIQI